MCLSGLCLPSPCEDQLSNPSTTHFFKSNKGLERWFSGHTEENLGSVPSNHTAANSHLLTLVSGDLMASSNLRTLHAWMYLQRSMHNT